MKKKCSCGNELNIKLLREYVDFLKKEIDKLREEKNYKMNCVIVKDDGIILKLPLEISSINKIYLTDTDSDYAKTFFSE